MKSAHRTNAWSTNRGARPLGRVVLAALAAMLVAAVATPAAAAVIFVTTTEQKISSSGGCSLQEAISSANEDDNTKAIASYDKDDQPVRVTTECVSGSGDDIIVLPTRGTFVLKRAIDDAGNPLGPTATPLITSVITIRANGATLQPESGGTGFFRLFSVGAQGHLTILRAYIRNFTVKGGDGGSGGGGGGMGAGGAVYVFAGGTLVVDGSTFAGNSAIGGNGGERNGRGGGGGGGFGGNGGDGAPTGCQDGEISVNGGGGGGARGNGGTGQSCVGGGGGGGTLRSGRVSSGGFNCGGDGGFQGVTVPSTAENGHPATCAGGGGGGGQEGILDSGNGGLGFYGGGGGGGSQGGGVGGNSAFGGGGGSGWEGILTSGDGGDGGFGGGGGSGSGGNAVSGAGGRFGGGANVQAGGGGAALGGAIFSDRGFVTIRNSTFTQNLAIHGLGGNVPSGGHAPHGQNLGGAIFSRGGTLTVKYATIAGNATGSTGSPYGGIAMVQDGTAGASFTLQNTIVANNGTGECFVDGTVTKVFAGNLITANDNCGTPAKTDDPALGPLQANGGATPTMAITLASAAANHAEPSVTFDGINPVARDQRLEVRPSNGGYDIGAFEFCVVIVGPGIEGPCPPTESSDEEVVTLTLTIQVSPAGGGTTSPSGTSSHAIDSVAPISATPSTGYYFSHWSGDPVTSSASPATTIIMTANRTITANFALIPDFTLAVPPVNVLVGSSRTATVTLTANEALNHVVTLTASSLPTGIGASYTPVAPVVSLPGSDTSVMTVTVAAFVFPGTYVFNVVGTATGLAGPNPTTTHSVPVSVTVAATPSAVSAVIDVLTAAGCIDSAGVANAFQAKLTAAQALINAGQTRQAANTLEALLHQLRAQQGRHIAGGCVVGGQQVDPTALLIAQVEAILASLGATTKPNPVLGSVQDTAGGDVAGAVITIANGSKKQIASATADATGFYYFAATDVLQTGSAYTVSINPPKEYKTAAPASLTLSWQGTKTVLSTFVVR